MNHIFLDSPYYLFQSFFCNQIMTRNNCEQHGLQHFGIRPKKGGKEDVARMLTGQLLLENLNSEPESAMRGSDFSVDLELFGPIWDNIDSKDGVAERSDERACEPGVEFFTSDSE